MVTGASYTPPVTLATFRRSAVAAAVLAVVALAVTIPFGHGLFGLFAVVGLGLGVLNSAMVVQAVTNFSATQPSKGRFTRSVLGRLALITIVALGCVLLFRPAGIATVVGLALFQFVGVVSSMLPLIKEIRQK